VIAFLASDDAGFVEGVILPVDRSLAASDGQPFHRRDLDSIAWTKVLPL
jgi:hypothetical protein